jgi:hypothetical protein
VSSLTGLIPQEQNRAGRDSGALLKGDGIVTLPSGGPDKVSFVSANLVPSRGLKNNELRNL